VRRASAARRGLQCWPRRMLVIMEYRSFGNVKFHGKGAR
jgi:hypothetical protein